jgi:hypothetical protein
MVVDIVVEVSRTLRRALERAMMADIVDIVKS